jgi:hypothetical protein
MNAAVRQEVFTAPGAIRVIRDGEPGRIGFMPKHFGADDMMRIENRIYNYADAVLEGYTGGSWDFGITPSGAGFMIPPAGTVAVPVYPDLGSAGDVQGGYEWQPSEISCYDGGPITRQAAGLALTILAVNHQLPNARQPERLLALWDSLMEYRYEHAEAATLYRILD